MTGGAKDIPQIPFNRFKLCNGSRLYPQTGRAVNGEMDVCPKTINVRRVETGGRNVSYSPFDGVRLRLNFGD